jgi:iron complex transport system ATP-binding protein
VLHDLPIGMHADRIVVLRSGRLVAAGAPDDPRLQRALESVFDAAIRIDADDAGGPRVALVLERTQGSRAA